MLRDSSRYRETARNISKQAERLRDLCFDIKNIGNDSEQWSTHRSRSFQSQKVQLHSSILAKYEDLKNYEYMLLNVADQIDAENLKREKMNGHR